MICRIAGNDAVGDYRRTLAPDPAAGLFPVSITGRPCAPAAQRKSVKRRIEAHIRAARAAAAPDDRRGRRPVNTADGVLIENELDLGAADNVNVGGFNVNGNQGNTSISNVIVDTYGPCIQTQPNAVYTIDNATLNSTNVSCIALTALDVGSLAVTDTIFSNALMAITGALPSGGMTVDYCAFVENGTDAIAARDDGINVPTYGVNLINADPLYVSKDATSADAFDVNAAAYSAAGTTGSDLAGGADYVGSDVAEWSLY